MLKTVPEHANHQSGGVCVCVSINRCGGTGGMDTSLALNDSNELVPVFKEASELGAQR